MPALLTSGLPRSADFVDWTKLEDRPAAPPHTENYPFGYRFRTSPEPSGEPIPVAEYDPERQLAALEDGRPLTPFAKGTLRWVPCLVNTSLDGLVIKDPILDEESD